MGKPGLIARVHGRDYCPVALPWFGFTRRRDRLSAVRRATYAWKARRHPMPAALRVARFALTWPFTAARNSLRAVSDWGDAVQALDGVSRASQLRCLWWLALTENVSPETFYTCGLWRPAWRARARHYLQEFEAIWACNMAHEALDADLLKNKLRFFRACLAHNLPTIPVLAVFGPGHAEHWFTDQATAPAGDLFVKPVAMSCGIGAQRWRHDPASCSWQRGPQQLGWRELLAQLRREARRDGLMLQPFLANNHEQAMFSGGALATLRVLACRPRGEQARAIVCTWRMPVGDAEADNFSAGGICAAVTPGGVLGPGRRKRIGPVHPAHPDTGAPITGAALPGFDAMRRLALHAHDTLQFDGFVGWDVTCGVDGPVLVEGNPTWGPNVLQCSHDAPLGDTAVPELFGRLASEARTCRRVADGATRVRLGPTGTSAE